jgi:endonuclease YncB( thermonuclease family)
VAERLTRRGAWGSLGLALALAAAVGAWLMDLAVPGRTAGETRRSCALEKVLDGDSLILACGGESVEVRLHCIDAPEHGQVPWDRRSRRHLRELAAGDLVLVERDLDRYGRIVGDLYGAGSGRSLINLEQVSSGNAAVYRRYCDDPRFDRAEAQARRAGLGIWAVPGEQQTPWVYRHRERR